MNNSQMFIKLTSVTNAPVWVNCLMITNIRRQYSTSTYNNGVGYEVEDEVTVIEWVGGNGLAVKELPEEIMKIMDKPKTFTTMGPDMGPK